MARVLPLKSHRPRQALEQLNRLTGLDFQRWPESLLDCREEAPSPRSAGPRQQQR